MNNEEANDYLQQLCIDNNVELLTTKQKDKKTKRKKRKKRYIFDTNININNIEFENSNKNELVKISKEKVTQRECELIKKQLKNVPFNKKLRKSDIHRIVKHSNTSIFDSEDCCLWTGYVTNMSDDKKGTYINFYFKNKKKVALHRLLYINFKGELKDTDYIKYSCENKGRCCNINHMVCFEYNLDETKNKSKSKKQTKKSKKIQENKYFNDNNFTVSFF